MLVFDLTVDPVITPSTLIFDLAENGSVTSTSGGGGGGNPPDPVDPTPSPSRGYRPLSQVFITLPTT